MEDIVERLRQWNRDGAPTAIPPHMIMAEAANMIERLRHSPPAGGGRSGVAEDSAAPRVQDGAITMLTHPELEAAIKSVTAYDDCQIGMLDYSQLWRLVVAARQYVWMLRRLEEQRELAHERFAELKRAQGIINRLRDYRESLLTCRADLEPAGRLRIVELSNPPRDDHDRAVLLLVADYERLLKAMIVPTTPAPVDEVEEQGSRNREELSSSSPPEARNGE